MPNYLINIDSKSRGALKYGFEHPDGKFSNNDLIPYLNGIVGSEYQIISIDPVSDEDYEKLKISGLSKMN